jgi:uncharacterized cupredoxin-like copper-binding protein
MDIKSTGSRLLCLFIAAAIGNVYAAGPQQTVGVKLQDNSTDPSIPHMRVVTDTDTLKPGRVTFIAVNQSKSLVHEFIVARDSGARQLPFDPKKNVVIEKRIARLGEIAELAPGKTGKLTVNLKPGKYLLICNQPGHYRDGMVTRITVAP